MASEVKLPEIGEGVSEGELVKWLVKVGDQVRADQPVAEVMTDKATVEVPTPFAGVVKELKFKEGDVIKVENVMVVLESDTSGKGVEKAPEKSTSKTAPVTMTAPPPTAGTTGQANGMRQTPSATAAPTTPAGASFFPPAAEAGVLATPSTRRLAREMKVDINQIPGTGLAGRVTRDDVLGSGSQGGLEVHSNGSKPAFVAKPSYQSPVGAVEERVPLRGIRKKIAENLQMAKHIIPHFTLMDEANVSSLVELRAGLKERTEKEGTKITYLPFVMKALIATVRQFPQFNASIDDAAQEIVYKKYFNIGFAADTPNGLVVPVIKNADQKSILEISREIIDLSRRARDGKLKPEEMKGATITITNIGSVGGTYATPIINHPEVAILGMYKIQDKPVIQNGALSSIKTMNFTITADHRLIDGAVAAQFLKAFFSRIESPGSLMMDMI